MSEKRDQKEYYKQYYKDHKEYYKQRHINGYHKKYRKENNEAVKKYNKEHNEKNKDLYRNHHLVNTYNITLESYNILFAKQDGKCAICGKHQSELKNRLSVDHNHITGKVRGLLCHNCNVSLGYAKEDINVLLNMIVYLKKEAESLDFSVKQ